MSYELLFHFLGIVTPYFLRDSMGSTHRLYMSPLQGLVLNEKLFIFFCVPALKGRHMLA
jgi:hypothetical protein